MAWDVRPTTDLEEFVDAVGAISHYFGSERAWRRAERFAKRAAVRADARRLRRRPDRRRCRGVPVRADRAGRADRVRRRHRRRRAADPSPARRAHRDDARPARGRPRARGADRGALGLGGGDLPALRLWPGFVRGRDRARERLQRPAAAARQPRVGPPDHARGGEGPRSAHLRPGAARRRRACSGVPRTGGSSGTSPIRRTGARAGASRTRCSSSWTAEPAGYALYRVHMKFEQGAAAGKLDVIEALADGPVATRELWRVLLDMDWKATLEGRPPPDRPPAPAPARLPAPDAHADRRRALGAAR